MRNLLPGQQRERPHEFHLEARFLHWVLSNQPMARNPGDIVRFTEAGVQARQGFVHSVFSWGFG